MYFVIKTSCQLRVIPCKYVFVDIKYYGLGPLGLLSSCIESLKVPGLVGKGTNLFTVVFGIEAILLNSWIGYGVVPVSLCTTAGYSPIEYLRRHKAGLDSH